MTAHYGMRPAAYTTDPYGHIAVPNSHAGFVAGYADKLPVVLGGGRVREMAREVADGIIEAARNLEGPVVWITGNAYVPPLRDITAAEYVWQADNNRDGELWAWFAEMVDDRLQAASVLMECPDYDNALYAVDLQRWEYRDYPVCRGCGGRLEETDQYPEVGYVHADDADDTHLPDLDDDLNSEWEPRDPDAVDDNAENPRE